jgi:uncharacterized protein YkwD
MRGLFGLLILVSVVATDASLERRVHDLVNAERRMAGRSALAWDASLAAIARAHSQDMAKRHFFAHVNPDGEDPTARGRHAHYECHKILSTNVDRVGLAENLYEASGAARDDIEHRSVAGWMNSPGHRQNILEKTYTKTGIGVAEAGDAIYITQLFC